MEYSLDDLIMHLAGEVYGLFLEMNRGLYPRSYDDWLRVAKRLGLRVHRGPSFAPCLLDDLVIIGDPANDAEACRWLAHEIVEAALRSEHRPPLVIPGTCSAICHQVAELLEEYA